MSIAERIEEACRRQLEGAFESALIQVSIALDATAKFQYPHIKQVGTRYKLLCADSSKLITGIASGGPTIERFQFEFESQWIDSDADGLVDIEQIYYHLIRCCLVHEGRISDQVVITSTTQEGLIIELVDGNRLSFSPSIIVGLLAAAIGSPVHEGNNELPAINLEISKRPIPISSLWGKRDLMLEYLDVLSRLTG